jgi:hypothetical protein
MENELEITIFSLDSEKQKQPIFLGFIAGFVVNTLLVAILSKAIKKLFIRKK